MDKLKRFLNGDDRDDDSSTGILPNLDATTLSWSTRITGFIVCFIIGIILSLFGSISLFLHKGLTLFAVFYTLGNVVSMMRFRSRSIPVACCDYETRRDGPNAKWLYSQNGPKPKPTWGAIFFSKEERPTCFLMGPVKQLKRMFAHTRVISTVLVIVMIGVTLFAALYLRNAPLCLLFLILQWLAMVWYSLSYIPYARDAVKKTFESCIA